MQANNQSPVCASGSSYHFSSTKSPQTDSRIFSDKSTGYFEREYMNLREHPDEFKDLTRMSPDLFDSILEQIGDRLVKHCLRVPIGAEERLFVTLM